MIFSKLFYWGHQLVCHSDDARNEESRRPLDDPTQPMVRRCIVTDYISHSTAAADMKREWKKRKVRNDGGDAKESALKH